MIEIKALGIPESIEQYQLALDCSVAFGKIMGNKPNIENPNIHLMVSRFLEWNLPREFKPDCHITFNYPTSNSTWPTGTNLFTAEQAREMIEYILETPK